MKFIYIITWCIVTIIPIPCPQKDYTDQYGIKHSPSLSCAALHYRREYDCDHKKRFYIRDSAISFLKGAGKHTGIIDSIKIDSIKSGGE